MPRSIYPRDQKEDPRAQRASDSIQKELALLNQRIESLENERDHLREEVLELYRRLMGPSLPVAMNVNQGTLDHESTQQRY